MGIILIVLMVVGYFNAIRSMYSPNEADAKLIIDADGMLAFPVIAKCFQSVPRWRFEIVKQEGGFHMVEFSLGNAPDLLGAPISRPT